MSPLDRVRKANTLVKLAAQESNPDVLILMARQLRRIGRPDKSFEALEKCKSLKCKTLDWGLEKLLTLAALGNEIEAYNTLLNLSIHFPIKPALQLIQVISKFSGGLPKSNLRKILCEDCSTLSLNSILSKFPLNAVHKCPWKSYFKLIKPFKTLSKLKFLVLVGLLKTYYFFLNLISNCLLVALQLMIRRPILISSMGNFTRLADLVDRVDPALRSLHNNEKFKSTLIIILYFDGYPNDELYQMYASKCLFIKPKNRLIRAVCRRIYNILNTTGHSLDLTVDYRFIKDSFTKNPPVITFNVTRSMELDAQLKKIGINPSLPIICFGLRDMAYYRLYGQTLGIDISKVKRGETWHRCPPLESYLRVVDFWARKGYQVIRMGLRVSSQLPENRHSGVIDYANKDRNDALDAYLLSKCHFAISGDTGLFSGAAAFDRPAVLSDLFLIRNTMYSSNKSTPNIFVPKLVFDHNEQRILSFEEWIYFNHHFSFAQDCEGANFELIHNTSEDILEATQELADRLVGIYKSQPGDDVLQMKFHSLYSPYQVGYQSSALISAGFLRRYKHLL